MFRYVVEIILFAEIDHRPRPRNAEADETVKRNEQVFRIHFVTVLLYLPPRSVLCQIKLEMHFFTRSSTAAPRDFRFLSRNFASYGGIRTFISQFDNILHLQYYETREA